ncbi:betaine--homocysteine S-methyltransferase 1-like isoform X1 [Asterias rubens]|uniref:betaine--homocysteine S-methyltransferase 1-like isoform X1 n=1 Tax=Asterias rubens TaxID=7604 RepID=UPI001455B66B|nr:betaine--homocysteine S-methyltransferase 1-like isoform X1 [Asterias rubens]
MESSSSKKKGLLERLEDGVVIGDGSYVVNLEKRGYVTAGMWTPEAVLKYPEAVLQLHRDYLRAGADILTTFTFYSNDERFKVLEGQTNGTPGMDGHIHARDLNLKACDLARQVASEGDALVAGGFSPVRPFSEDKSKEHIQAEFKKQADVFQEKKVDCLLGEFFGTVEEAEWAIEVMKTLDIPVVCSMRVPPSGDEDGILPQECAVRMARAGADVVGVNCMYDPTITLKTLALMKRGLEEAGLKAYLMAQPVGYHTTEVENDPRGYVALPEFPFAMEPRLLTRMDVHTFTRKAYELGVKYIGGCCGYEPYHIRASAEELAAERGCRPPGADNHEGFKALERSSFKEQWERANPEYWANLVPAAGRKIKFLATD